MSINYWSLLKKVVFARQFPCVAAQKVMRDGDVGWREVSEPFGSARAALETWQALAGWAESSYPGAKAAGAFRFSSFAAIYPQAGEPFSDLEADKVLWEFLTRIHRIDRSQYPWDFHYSKCPYDLTFEMSLAGHGHFVVLMGPQATTVSRWFPVSVIIFNPSFVFEKLRAVGMYGKWRDLIRSREISLQKGWINPKLGDFGTTIAAPQYALTLKAEFDIGKCPFTGAPRPSVGLESRQVSNYPFSPGEVERLFWNSITADF